MPTNRYACGASLVLSREASAVARRHRARVTAEQLDAGGRISTPAPARAGPRDQVEHQPLVGIPCDDPRLASRNPKIALQRRFQTPKAGVSLVWRVCPRSQRKTSRRMATPGACCGGVLLQIPLALTDECHAVADDWRDSCGRQLRRSTSVDRLRIGSCPRRGRQRP